MMKQMESDDPFEMVGVVVPTAPGEDVTALMARSFVEEFALMGCTAEQILRVFKNRFYVGAHAVYEQRGEGFIRDIIGQVLSPDREGHANA